MCRGQIWRLCRAGLTATCPKALAVAVGWESMSMQCQKKNRIDPDGFCLCGSRSRVVGVVYQ